MCIRDRTVQADRIEELRTRLRKYAETHVTMAELVPLVHIDCMVQSEWLTQENIESLSVLEPYGMKNAEPVFCMKNMTVEEITPLSSEMCIRDSRFRVRGDTVEIWPVYSDEDVVRIEFFGDEVDRISRINPLTGVSLGELGHIAVFPASHYVTPKEKLEEAIKDLEEELEPVSYTHLGRKCGY